MISSSLLSSLPEEIWFQIINFVKRDCLLQEVPSLKWMAPLLSTSWLLRSLTVKIIHKHLKSSSFSIDAYLSCLISTSSSMDHSDSLQSLSSSLVVFEARPFIRLKHGFSSDDLLTDDPFLPVSLLPLVQDRTFLRFQNIPTVIEMDENRVQETVENRVQIIPSSLISPLRSPTTLLCSQSIQLFLGVNSTSLSPQKTNPFIFETRIACESFQIGVSNSITIKRGGITLRLLTTRLDRSRLEITFQGANVQLYSLVQSHSFPRSLMLDEVCQIQITPNLDDCKSSRQDYLIQAGLHSKWIPQRLESSTWWSST